MASQRPRPGYSALAAVNGAVEALCRALALELAPTRVNAVSPSLIDTPVHDTMPKKEREAFFSTMAEALPVQRIGVPEDVAESVFVPYGQRLHNGSQIGRASCRERV